MSHSEDSRADFEADRLAARWMDGDVHSELSPQNSSTPDAEPADATVEHLPLNAKLRAADVQLIHALLLQFSSEEAAKRQTRIGRVIDTLHAVPTPAGAESKEAASFTRRGFPRLRRVARWTVAASLLMAAAAWFYFSSSNPALAALEQVVLAIDSQLDRTYRISVEPSDGVPQGGRPQAVEDSDRRDLPPRRAGLDGATLYVRGGDQFVLFRIARGDNPLIQGSNGRENWLVRPNGSVLVSFDPGDFRVPMPESLAAIPFVDIRASLAGLRQGYRIEELQPEMLGSGDSTLWRHLRATKIDPSTKGPKAVSIWFHPATRLIGKIRFEQVHMQGRPEPRRLTMLLVNHEPLPANWFDHGAHHASDQPVEQVGL